MRQREGVDVRAVPEDYGELATTARERAESLAMLAVETVGDDPRDLEIVADLMELLARRSQNRPRPD